MVFRRTFSWCPVYARSQPIVNQRALAARAWMASVFKGGCVAITEPGHGNGIPRSAIAFSRAAPCFGAAALDTIRNCFVAHDPVASWPTTLHRRRRSNPHAPAPARAPNAELLTAPRTRRTGTHTSCATHMRAATRHLPPPHTTKQGVSASTLCSWQPNPAVGRQERPWRALLCPSKSTPGTPVQDSRAQP